MFQGAFADLIQTGSCELMGVSTREALPNLSHQAASRPRGLGSPIPRSRRSVVVCPALALVLLALGGRSRTGANCNYGCNYLTGRGHSGVTPTRQKQHVAAGGGSATRFKFNLRRGAAVHVRSATRQSSLTGHWWMLANWDVLQPRVQPVRVSGSRRSGGLPTLLLPLPFGSGQDREGGLNLSGAHPSTLTGSR
jgi:hypothetical protein